MGTPKDRLSKNVRSTTVTTYSLTLEDIHDAIVSHYGLPQNTSIQYEARSDGLSRHAVVSGAVATTTEVYEDHD